MKIAAFPLARVTFFFVLGILFAVNLQPAPGTILLVLGIAAALTVAIYGLVFKYPKINPVFGITAAAFSLLCGITTQSLHNDLFQKSNYIHRCRDPEKIHSARIVLREKLKSTASYDRYIAIMRLIDAKACTGKVLVNIKKEADSIPFEIGSELFLTGKIIRHKPPYNPDQFDYGRYLTHKSIFSQLYVRKSQIKRSGIEKSIWYYADKFRDRIIGNLERKHFSKEELHVVTALLLGQQQEISQETLRDYQFAGAVHVLSVSGLHVGFLLLFIQFLLSALPKNKTGNLIRFIAITVTLWLFAFIAGMSPSIVRSVTMFSFVAAGLFLNRETNIFHTLLVSILLILLVSPSFLFDVGFQLSYVSLFFIVWLQPGLAALWVPKYKISQYFWNILTVSVAAQLGAFPLSIYYFHQFPGLFFMTNLVILPGWVLSWGSAYWPLFLHFSITFPTWLPLYWNEALLI